MKFSYSDVWNDAVSLLRSNAAIVVALAGVFIFLPMLLLAHFLPPPVPEKPAEMLGLYVEYSRANWHWLLLHRLVVMVGEISLLLMFLDSRGRNVGALIAAAIVILPFYFLASFLSGLLTGLGLLLLIVPGLYLLGRLTLVGPEVVASGARNPIDAIRRSFELTSGNGWAVVGLFLLVWIAGAIVTAVIGMLSGIAFLAIPGGSLGALLTRIANAIAGAALEAVIVALVAALYRKLSSPASVGAANIA